MNYPHSTANGTQDLLARITRDQASLQARALPQPMPSTATAAPKKKAKSAEPDPKKKKEPDTPQFTTPTARSPTASRSEGASTAS